MQSQLERLSEVLERMRINITEEDRKLARLKYYHSAATLSRYLNGKGASIDTAITLIEFFKGRIAERDKIANWVPPLESEQKQQKQLA